MNMQKNALLSLGSKAEAAVRNGRWTAALSAVVAAAAVTLGVPGLSNLAAGASTASVTLQGQGSTYAALAFQTWIQGAEVNKGLSANYTATGTAAGLVHYAASPSTTNPTSVTFAGSQAEFSELYPTTPGYESHVPRGFAYAPDVASAMAVMYQVSATATGSNPVTDLHLSPLTVARIFLRVITTWASPTIAADNPGLTLPHRPISLFLRSGESGTTALFFDWLKQADPADFATWAAANGFSQTSRVWEVDNGTGPYRQSAEFFGGADLMAQAIAAQTGRWSIGFDPSGYSYVYHDEVAFVENASGNWVQPSARAIDTALQSATLGPDTSETLAGVYASPTPAAYPMSFYSYLIYQCASTPTAPTCRGTYATPSVADAMATFMRYIACTGQTEMAAIGYAPLPPKVAQLMADAVGYMTDRPPETFTAANCANPQFPAWTAHVSVSAATISTTRGQPVTLGATVTSGEGNPTGSVTFTIGTTTMCTATISAGSASCTATDVPAGTHVLTATYGGDADFSPASGTATLTVTGIGTGLTLTPPPPPTANGTLAGPVVGMAARPGGDGYWLVDAAGAVSAHGNAVDYGSMAGQALDAPITHIVATTDGGGYWLVAADGGTFAFGDAGFYGSMGGQHLNAPVIDIAPTPDGQGYWLVASDGGIFAFGDAQFHGSMGGQHLNQPVVAVAADPASGGYWEVASDGGVFAFGAPFYGSTGTMTLNKPVNGMASTPAGQGYWLVASDGGIFAFGDAPFYGSTGGLALASPIVGMAPDGTSGGYWLVEGDGGIFAFGAPFYGAD